jgi:hypothetical protein
MVTVNQPVAFLNMEILMNGNVNHVILLVNNVTGQELLIV